MRNRRGRSSFLLILLLFAIFLFSSGRTSAQAVPPSAIFSEGEELVYNVRYSFFNLGQVRIKTLNKMRTATYTAYQTKALIDSYPKVPFVDLHAVYESLVDSTVCSRGFVGKGKEDERWNFARYSFEYDRNRLLMEVGNRDTVIAKRETVEVLGPYNDGLSIFFFARDHLMDNKKLTVPCVVMEKKTTMRLDFKTQPSSVEIDAIDYPVDVVHFDGSADFVGIFGLTGDFEGWFSNDVARVPIMAKMKVIIGSVTIELMEWKRPGWSPPKGNG
jgi:hypothetical protein